MKNRLTIIWLSLLVCFFAQASLPDWVLNPPLSETEIYAVGQGRSLQESEQAAVKNILGQLRTRIDSSLQISQHAVNDAFKETIEQSVNASIENFPISQYQILKRHQDGEVIYTQAKASKRKLRSALSAEVKANNGKIDNIFSLKETSGSALEWWVTNKRQLFADHAANSRYIQILTLLDADSATLSKRVASDRSRIANTAKDICLYVSPTKHRELQLALRGQVVQLGIPADRQTCLYKLNIETQNKEGQLFGKFTSSLTMKATLFQKSNALTFTEVVQSGQSMSSQQMANKAALTLLTQRLEDDEQALLDRLLAN